MKVIYNNIIPFKGFKAVNLFGVVFARESLSIIDKNHESIHTAQMKELGYILFYIIYLIEYLILYRKYKDSDKAYRNISFEKEAYNNQDNLLYLKTRKPFKQWHKDILKRKIK